MHVYHLPKDCRWKIVFWNCCGTFLFVMCNMNCLTGIVHGSPSVEGSRGRKGCSVTSGKVLWMMVWPDSIWGTHLFLSNVSTFFPNVCLPKRGNLLVLVTSQFGNVGNIMMMMMIMMDRFWEEMGYGLPVRRVSGKRLLTNLVKEASFCKVIANYTRC